MSRVIKGIVWNDDPRIISVPKHGNGEVSTDMERLSDQAYQDMMENLKAREARAEQMLRDAKIECEMLKIQAVEEGKAKVQADTQEWVDSTRRQLETEVEELKRTTYETAYKEGLEQGRKDGEEAVRQEQKHIIDAANEKSQQTWANTLAEMDKYMVESENLIAEMVLQIADKILHKHLIDVPQVILPMVSEAIKKVQDQPKVTVRVSPEAYEYVLPARSELQSMLDGNATLQVAADETMGVGDCIVDSPNGTVDARLSTQMEQIKLAVRDMMN